MSELFQGSFVFFPYMFVHKDKNVKFFNLWVYCKVTSIRKTTKIRENVSCVLKDLSVNFGLIASAHACSLHCFPWWKLFSTSADTAALTPRASCSSSNCFLLICRFICVTHFMNSKCKNLVTFSITNSHKRRKQNVPDHHHYSLFTRYVLIDNSVMNKVI